MASWLNSAGITFLTMPAGLLIQTSVTVGHQNSTVRSAHDKRHAYGLVPVRYLLHFATVMAISMNTENLTLEKP